MAADKSSLKSTISQGAKKKYFDFLEDNGIECYPGSHMQKPYLNSISPGCVSCLNGTWGCVFINSLCTRRCFFCGQDRDDKAERELVIDKIHFNSFKPALDYLNKYDFSGIAFSGGEPFMMLERVTGILEGLKKNSAGKYTWIYTNGDNLSAESLATLSRLGLNEIRFNISARGYDLAPLLLAGKFLDTVSIEIPAIPGDLDIVKKQLQDYEKAGVKYLNLHQLFATKFNYEELTGRGYTLCDKDFLLKQEDGITAIHESEDTALEILKYAKSISSGIGINYCSLDYNNIFSGPFLRKRYIKFADKKVHITEPGLEREIKRTEKGFSVNYYVYENQNKKAVAEINDIKLDRKIIRRVLLENNISWLFFSKLFIENWDTEKLTEFMVKNYYVDRVEVTGDIENFLANFSDVEGGKEK